MGDEDYYLAEVTSGKSPQALARIVHHYSSFSMGLSEGVLKENSGTKLKAWRDESCDCTYGELSRVRILNAAGAFESRHSLQMISPGPMPDIPPDTNIPCYRLSSR
jgi:hypothetical protein